MVSESLNRWQEPVRREVGASLVLALIFMTVVSLIVISMAAWATTGLRSTISFTKAQQTISASNSMAELAIQETRYNFLSASLAITPPAECWPGSSNYSLPTPPYSPAMGAWCSALWNPSSASATRKVTIDICLATVTAAICQLTPLLQVIVTYDDYPVTGGFPVCQPESSAPSEYWLTCGTYMKVNSWVYGLNPPTVISSASPATSLTTCTTTNSFSLTGTNFITGAGSTNVYFVVDASTNKVYAATNVTVSNSGYLTGCDPSVGGTGNTLAYVLVTTPMGESPQTVQIKY